MSENNNHISVMLHEVVDAVIADPNGVYIDATFGRGGHSTELLRRLGPEGKLIAIDQDPAAAASVSLELQQDPRFSLLQMSFAALGALEAEYKSSISGIIADLGVSSPQLDQAERGFSFLRDGTLDMRMNPTSGHSVAEWLAVVPETELADIIWRFGDERFSRQIAKAIVNTRSKESITTTLQLAGIVKDAHPRWPKHHHPATKTFQAMRIYINQELAALESFLPQAEALLQSGGRLAILTFHSLEDRIVKQYIKGGKAQVPANIPLTEAMLRQYNQHGLCGVANKTPSQEEIDLNPRARSARLRVAEKT